MAKASRWCCPFTLAALAVNHEATPSTWGLGVSEPVKWHQDQVIRRISFVRVQDRRCCAVYGQVQHNRHIWLCCIPLVARVSALRIFSCIVVKVKNFTFDSALAFQSLPCWIRLYEPWNCILYADAVVYSSFSVHFQRMVSFPFAAGIESKGKKSYIVPLDWGIASQEFWRIGKFPPYILEEF
jgi:hypothetical protein